MLELPDALFMRFANRMLAIDPLARSSIYEDLRAGRRTEVDYINGEIVRLARKHGTDAPANDRARPRRGGRWPQVLRRGGAARRIEEGNGLAAGALFLVPHAAPRCSEGG